MLKRRFSILGKSIPILVPMVITLLVVAVALAAVVMSVTQHITQDIFVTEPPDYGSITAPTIDMPNVGTGDSGSKSVVDGVIVGLGPAGVDKYLHLDLTDINVDIDLYGVFSVTLTCTAIPGAPTNIDVGATLIVEKGGALAVSQQLDGVGVYKFTETIAYTAGGSEGSADITVDVTLEDDPEL